MYLRKSLSQALLACVLLFSCDQELMDKQADQSGDKPVPLSIEYNEHLGSLSHFVYLAKFKYNSADQLVSVTDSMLTSQVPSTNAASPWVNFYYQEGRLAEVVLRANEAHKAHYDPETDPKASRFYFTYEGDSVRTRHVIGGQQQGTFNFKMDVNGFPVRKNVRYGFTYLDAAGHIDFEAENNAAKARNPLGSWETLEMTFDQNKNIFENSKEFQMLGVLLAAYDWNMVTSFVPYLGILPSGNELSKTLRYCSQSEGCRMPGTVLNETSSVNANGYPTRRLVHVGVMGPHQFLIKYKEN